MNRQRLYQIKHKELGLCQNCPKPIFQGGLCQNHHKLHREIERHIYHKQQNSSPKKPCRYCAKEVKGYSGKLQILVDSPQEMPFKKDQIVKASRYDGMYYTVGIYLIDEKFVKEIK